MLFPAPPVTFTVRHHFSWCWTGGGHPIHCYHQRGSMRDVLGVMVIVKSWEIEPPMTNDPVTIILFQGIFSGRGGHPIHCYHQRGSMRDILGVMVIVKSWEIEPPKASFRAALLRPFHRMLLEYSTLWSTSIFGTLTFSIFIVGALWDVSSICEWCNCIATRRLPTLIPCIHSALCDAKPISCWHILFGDVQARVVEPFAIPFALCLKMISPSSTVCPVTSYVLPFLNPLAIPASKLFIVRLDRCMSIPPFIAIIKEAACVTYLVWWLLWNLGRSNLQWRTCHHHSLSRHLFGQHCWGHSIERFWNIRLYGQHQSSVH